MTRKLTQLICYCSNRYKTAEGYTNDMLYRMTCHLALKFMLLTAKRDKVIATMKVGAIESAKDLKDKEDNMWKNLVLVLAVKKGWFKTKPTVVASLRYREWLNFHRLGKLIYLLNHTDYEKSPKMHVFPSY